jgi:hypothetical protein
VNIAFRRQVFDVVPMPSGNIGASLFRHSATRGPAFWLWDWHLALTVPIGQGVRLLAMGPAISCIQYFTKLASHRMHERHRETMECNSMIFGSAL